MSDEVNAAAEYIRLHPDKTMGPWLCGGLADFLLMGALVAMFSEYWERYGQTDAWQLKSAVWVVLFLNVIRTAQTFAALWHKLIANFGDYIAAATSSPWYTQYDPLTTVVTCLVVQAFFAARLHRLTGGLRWLLVILVPAMAMALGGHIAVTVQIHYLSSVRAIALFNKTMYVGLCGLMAADLVITAALSHFLWKSKTGYRRTDSLIWRLLHVTWVTAALPCLSELLNLVVYITELGTGNSTFIFFHFLGPKLYSLSMMYTLNARQSLRSRDNTFALTTVDNVQTARIEVNREVVQFEDGRRTDGATSVKFSEIGDDHDRVRHGSRGTDTKKTHPIA
ncbi:hypothetical protein EXIGLDRAFT_99135 [Exidia glandulosa HHB12029]|uniref:DUF6534 domain-containing protein n=1 Tax=Exidia glandulosa HHB12029 TaxID=1314781 RepID=A0A165NQ07_EXIGL|nr:hypothetical protein EXIGLDRAFT_99135 [Exidia glandulosa HHB12029]